MKITDVEVLHLRSPLESYDVGGGVEHPLAFDSTVVRIHTDDGISGIGESWLVGSSDLVLKSHIETQLSAVLVGQDPLESTRLWYEMWKTLYRMGGFARGLSAVDQALWDIKGKCAGLPVYQLLGGKAQPALTVYVTSPAQRDDPQQLVEDIRRFQGHGFQAAKLIVGLGFERDRDLITNVHEEVGKDVKLAMDANGGCDVHHALRLSRVAESLDFMWFEEPLPWYNVTGLAELKQRVDIPTAGFQELASIWLMREYLEKDALSFYNVTVETCGGITAMQKMGSMLEAWGCKLVPHGFGPPICFAATLHTAISQPSCGFLEFPVPDRTNEEPRRWNTAPYVRHIEDFEVDARGQIAPPDRPGLGVELDEDVVESLIIR